MRQAEFMSKGKRVSKKKLPVTVALAGQPNVGKSTVFNAMTGMNQHVGNWPGKTVEKKTGKFNYNGNDYNVVDLPGTYSLTANSSEEVIARDFIIREKPDVVVVVVNAAALERNLYLVSEVLPLKTPVIIALNMLDVAEAEGHKIKPEALEKNLGIKVVPMIATKNKGVDNLARAIDQLAHGKNGYDPQLPEITDSHRAALVDIENRIEGYVPLDYPKTFVALKLLEGDNVIKETMKKALGSFRWAGIEKAVHDHDGAVAAIVKGRYQWIERMIKTSLKHPRGRQINLTARWDHYAAHPVWGFFIMLAMVTVALLLTKVTGLKLTWIAMDHLLPVIKNGASALLIGAPAWISSMVTDGIISGLGVLTIFSVFLIFFFALMGILEDVGYMARVGYLMHRFMQKIGLHGKSFFPLGVGFACNVPGVIGTRVAETERSRLMTILLTPFVPCIAQTGVTVFLAPIFFGWAGPLVIIGLILMNMIVLAFTGILLNRGLPGRERLGLIMELPLYHWPNPRTIGIYVFQQMKHFMHRAGTIIFSVTVLIWALGYFPHGDMETSLLASIGHFLMPLGDLMGLSWKMLVALFASFIAKETAIATMGVLLGGGDLAGALQATVSPAAGLGFLVTHMLFIPCVATLSVIVDEARSWKWALMIVVYLFIVAFGMGILAYQGARLII